MSRSFISDLTISINPGSFSLSSLRIFATAPLGCCRDSTGVEAGVGTGAAADADVGVTAGADAGVELGVSASHLMSLQVPSGIVTY